MMSTAVSREPVVRARKLLVVRALFIENKPRGSLPLSVLQKTPKR